MISAGNPNDIARVRHDTVIWCAEIDVGAVRQCSEIEGKYIFTEDTSVKEFWNVQNVWNWITLAHTYYSIFSLIHLFCLIYCYPLEVRNAGV